LVYGDAGKGCGTGGTRRGPPKGNPVIYRVITSEDRAAFRKAGDASCVRFKTCCSSPTRTRTWNKPVNSRKTRNPKDRDGNGLGSATGFPGVFAAPEEPAVCAFTMPEDLARVVTTWDGLPGPIKAAVEALVRAAAPTTPPDRESSLRRRRRRGTDRLASPAPFQASSPVSVPLRLSLPERHPSRLSFFALYGPQQSSAALCRFQGRAGRRNDQMRSMRETMSTTPTGADGPAPALITAAALARLLGVSLATLERMKARAELPDPIVLSAKCHRGREGEVRAWIDGGCPPRKEWETRRGVGRR
jgi:predicted DNA-binding transcriptional regulator AlpA